MLTPGIVAEPHEAILDRVYRHQRYIYDFTRKYYLFGRDRLIGELTLAPGERLLEIGSGTARNLIAIARRYPGAELYGLDASAEMLKTAARAVSRAGLDHRIKLAHGRAESLSPALFGDDRPFDRVVFSYSLSMIPQWEQALTEAGAILAPTGRMHVVDFGDFAGLSRPLARLLQGWLRLFHVEPRTRLLGALESTIEANKHSILWILPGRYAFGWSGTSHAASNLEL
jgi:S-adenosylmethionine-diacylgycerolhomoserine-N-methlytransferase